MAAQGATIGAVVRDSNGRTVPDAVVAVDALPAVATATGLPPVTRIVDQRDETFVPYVEFFRPGDRVVFRNSDDTRHHIYSFSPVNAFEMVLQPDQSSEPMVLDAPGVVVLGCNIHDNMIAYLFVSDADRLARTGRDGRARIDGLAPGSYTVRVWHPRLRPGNDDGLARSLTLADDDAVAEPGFELRLLPDPRRRGDRERVDY